MAHINEAPRLGAGTPRECCRLASLRPRDTKNLPHVQALRRLTARLAFMADWRDDLAERLLHAKQMQDAGCLFPIEIDDLADATRAWRLAAGRVVLDLGRSNSIMRRLA